MMFRFAPQQVTGYRLQVIATTNYLVPSTSHPKRLKGACCVDS